tara:strand:- start:152 stop:523 length:372 start_codon:yes stop_codon:yes gene_type:complete
MTTYQTYKKQAEKTFKIVDDVFTEYYQLLNQDKISEDDNIICTHSDLEKFDNADFKWLELQDKKIENNIESINLYKNLIKKLEDKNKDIERMTKNMKETIKSGNGIDRDYCKYLLEVEKEKNK